MTKASRAYSNAYYAANRDKIAWRAKQKRELKKLEKEADRLKSPNASSKDDIYVKGHNVGSPLLDTLIDPRDFFDKIDESVLKKDMWSYLKGTLTEREFKVLERRFLFGETLEEVGNLFSVGKERIRQLEARALRKCRHPTRAFQLMLFLDPDRGQKMLDAKLKADAERRAEDEEWKRESSKRRRDKKLLETERAKAGIREYYAKRLEEERLTKKWEDDNKERLKRLKENKAWWYEQIDNIKAMVDFNMPMIEYAGRCSCRKWKYEYQFSRLGFECLCERCGDRFMMRKADA